MRIEVIADECVEGATNLIDDGGDVVLGESKLSRPSHVNE